MGIREDKLSKDLTLILVRGNGTPRAFRIRVSNLTRSILSLSSLLLGLGLGCFVLLVLFFMRGSPIVLPTIEIRLPKFIQASTQEPPKAPPAVIADTSSQALDAIPAPDSVLREELSKLQASMAGREQMPSTVTGSGSANLSPVQLLSPNNTQVPAAELFIEAKNVRVNRNGTTVTLDFDLQNTHSQQQQIRGYIVALAKTTQALYAYPENGVLSPKDNFLVNYTKGETFAISRFRQASAKFTKIPADSGPVHFQVLLFDHTGKVLINSHIEGK